MYAKDLQEMIKISAALVAKAPLKFTNTRHVQLEFSSRDVQALVTDGSHGSIFTLRGALDVAEDDGGPVKGPVILDQSDCAVLVRELAAAGGLDRGPMPPVRRAMFQEHTAVEHGLDLGLVARVCGAAEKWLGPKTGTHWLNVGFGARLDAQRADREFASVIMGMRV